MLNKYTLIKQRPPASPSTWYGVYENCLQQDNFADTTAKIFLLQFEDNVPTAVFCNFT